MIIKKADGNRGSRVAQTSRVAHRRGDRVNTAYDRLRELIVTGRLAPGSRIIEVDVADRMGVSRTPARAALHRLQQEGYIISSGRGKQQRLSVAALTKEDARELFEIVGEIEGLGARRSALLQNSARTQVVRELSTINRRLSKAAAPARPNHKDIFDLDQEFHRCYVEAGAGPRLLALHSSIKPQSERYVRLYISALVDEIGTSVREHDEIIRAIRTGDADLAQSAVETNWRNAAERLSRVIESMGERGAW
jgi:DNA-binding GntR family transcriptional regulator